jgi:hypothetical protein
MTEKKSQLKLEWIDADYAGKTSYTKWCDTLGEDLILVRYKADNKPPIYGVAQLSGKNYRGEQLYNGYFYDSANFRCLSQGHRHGENLAGCVTKWWARRDAAIKVLNYEFGIR